MAASALARSALAIRVSSSTSGWPLVTCWPRLTKTCVMTPERSARTGIHSLGSTFPLVLSELTSVSRVTLTNSTSGGAAFLVATQVPITPAPTSRMASQLRLRLTVNLCVEWQFPFSQNLFQHHQRIAGAHCLARLRAHFDHASGTRGLHLVLHFHRLHHHQALPCIHRVSHIHQHADHFAGHWRSNILPPRSKSRAGASAGIARIADLHRKAPAGRLRTQTLRCFDQANLVTGAIYNHRIDTGLYLNYRR